MGDTEPEILVTGERRSVAPVPVPTVDTGATDWSRWFGVGAFLAVLAALFTLSERYAGIQKDALMYVLQGLARIEPGPLAGDVFLKFGSQDQLSVISLLSSRAIQFLGIDHGAALLTFCFLALWYLNVWALTRKIQGGTLALLSVGLLLSLPGWYGAKQIFRYAEPMMTARSLAEALSIAALLALISSRDKAALLLIALAMAVHPLMAFPVGVMIGLYMLRLRGVQSWVLATVALVVAAIAGALLAGLPSAVIDDAWLTLIRFRSNFLFTETWESHDWEIPAQVFSTLALGVLVLEQGAARRLLQSALAVGVAGLVLAVVASDWLPARLLIQGQPWRWEWIGRVLATALLPWVLIHAWQRDERVGRAVVALMSAGWLLGGLGTFQSLPPVGTGGLLCVIALAIWTLRRSLVGFDSRYSTVLSLAIVAATCISAVATLAVILRGSGSFSGESVWVQRLQDSMAIPTIAAVIVLAAWLALVVRQNTVLSAAFLAAASFVLLGAGPGFVQKWSDDRFGPEQREAFQEWRRLIPPEAEVLWPEAPQMVWYLLDRRSYMSISQGAGLVFSQQTANELVRRAEALAPLVTPGKWFLDPATNKTDFNELTSDRLRAICNAPGLSFVISRDSLPIAVRRAEWPGRADYIYLYDCSTVEHEA